MSSGRRTITWLAVCLGILSMPTAAFNDDNNGLSAEGLPLVERIEQLPAAANPLSDAVGIQQWATDHAQWLGLSTLSNLQVNVTAINARHNIAWLQQQVDGIDVFGHRSTLIVRDGQPYSLSRVTADVAVQPFNHQATTQKDLQRALQGLGIETSEATIISPLYVREPQQLTASWRLVSGLTKDGQHYPYEVHIAQDGRLLDTLPREFAIDYKLVDVDEMCRVMGVSYDIDRQALFELTDDYESTYGLATSAATAPTAMSRRLASLLDNGTDFLEKVLKQPGLDRANQVTLYALVGTKFGDTALNCGRNYNTNANFMAVNDSLSVTQIHAPFLDNPEVILHELAHGIVFYGSGLVYKAESGALNEAFSDAVGVAYAAWANGRTAAPSQRDWQLWIGTSQLLRDFAFPRRVSKVPAAIGQMPDHYSERYIGSADYGGVHYNSSIINHAFYLMVEGGQHRRLGSVEVPKIGMDKALQLWHFAVTRILTPVSDFRDARYAFADAAEILFGEYEMERTAVHKAFDAVGVKGDWVEKVRPPKVDPLPKPEVDKPKQPQQQPKVEVPKTPPSNEPPLPIEVKQWQLTTQHIGILAILIVMTMGLWLVLRRAKPGTVQRYGEYQPYQPAAAGGEMPQAKQRGPGRVIAFLHYRGERYPLTDNQLAEGITVGRSANADIIISNASVSSFHIKLSQRERQMRVEDLGSSYGTWLNGERINALRRYAFHLPAQLRLAEVTIQINSDDRSTSAAEKTPVEGLSVLINGRRHTLSSTKAAAGYAIGRASDNDLVLDNPTVSGRHGRILYRDQQWWFEDLNSSYGSAVKRNNQKIMLSKGERVKLHGVSKIYLSDSVIEINDTSDGTISL